MDTFTSRVAANILPLSVEQFDVKKAFLEWGYTGVSTDSLEPLEDCELCDHQGLRYQFEIQNHLTTKKLLVGSQCINRFQIGGEEGMEKVQIDLNKLLENARHQRVLFTLDALLPVFPQAAAAKIRYAEDLNFSPAILFELLALIYLHKIPFNPQDFVVRLRKHSEQNQLLEATDAQYQRILPCLSSTQKVKYSIQVLEAHRTAAKQWQKMQRSEEVWKASWSTHSSSIASANTSGWKQTTPLPPPKPQGIKSKYHGKCPNCGQDTYEKIIKSTAKGWAHAACVQTSPTV